MSQIQPTPREKHPDPKLRGDRISGDRYYTQEFMEKEKEKENKNIIKNKCEICIIQ